MEIPLPSTARPEQDRMAEDRPEPNQGCRYFAASGCLLALGAVLLAFLALVAVVVFLSGGVYAALGLLWG